MTDLTIPTAALSARLAGARNDLATISAWGGALPLELRLAVEMADCQLTVRNALPYPPTTPARQDPHLNVEKALTLIAGVRADLIAEIAGAADIPLAVSLGFAARELSDALNDAGRP